MNMPSTPQLLAAMADYDARRRPNVGQQPSPPVTYVTPTITIEVHSAAGKADLLKAIQFLAGLA